MKAFPFSLDGAAKDWLYLQLALFNTWGDMNSFWHLELRPSREKCVGLGSIQERLCMNIGKDLINSVSPIHTIRSANSC
ncbi:hypothetical protein CR513_48348, partial [Mucuna pruriens]